jgi:sugar phosphate isomerase/epimerase
MSKHSNEGISNRIDRRAFTKRMGLAGLAVAGASAIPRIFSQESPTTVMKDKSEIELLASYWTIAGGAFPQDGPQFSPFDLRDRAEACGRVGFKGMGFWHADVEHILETYSTSEMKQILDDNGIEHVELEFIMEWFTDGERRKAADQIRNLLLSTAEAVGARHIKIGDLSGDTAPMDRLIEEYSRLCEEGANHGTNIIFELIPGMVAGTLEEAMTMIEGANQDNGGLMLDMWHFHTLKIPNSTTAALPLKYLKGVELNDGPAEFTNWDDEVVNRRLLCGEGEFDIKGLIQAVQNAGYNGPYGVEVLNQAMRSWSLDDLVTRAYETTMAMF